MLPFDHKNGSAAARLIAVLAIAGVLSTSALTALAAVIDEAPDALAVLLEEGEAPDVEEAPTEETATPGEEADSSEGEAVPAEETEAPEEAPDADSPDAPTEEDEPEAPADETSEETAEEAPEGEGAESVPEEGISVPPEELPEDLAPLFIQISPALIEAAAEEFQTLTPEQTERYKSLWAENRFVYATMPEMMAAYEEIGGLSPQALFVMYLANARGCLDYTNAHYVGDSAYLAGLNALCDVYYDLAATVDVGREEDLAVMFAAYAEGISGLNDIKGAESAATGEEERFSEIFRAYGGEASAADAEAFFAAVTQ